MDTHRTCFRDYGTDFHSEHLGSEPGVEKPTLSPQTGEHSRLAGRRGARYLCGARDGVRLVAQAQLPHLVLPERKHGAGFWKERMIPQREDNAEGSERDPESKAPQ